MDGKSEGMQSHGLYKVKPTVINAVLNVNTNEHHAILPKLEKFARPRSNGLILRKSMNRYTSEQSIENSRILLWKDPVY